MSDNSVQEDIQDLFLLMRLRNAASRAFDSVGFKFQEAMLLIYVDKGVRQPQELLEPMNVVGSALSSLITRLAERELITRGSILGDGRRVSLQLTEQGREAAAEVKQAWAREIAKMRQEQ